jgi:hypothetical protein
MVGVTFFDANVEPDMEYEYTVRAVDRRQQMGPPAIPVRAAAKPFIREPVFVAALAENANGLARDGKTVQGRDVGTVSFAEGSADLRAGGHIQFQHRGDFDLRHALTVECWVRIDEPTKMPVILACGEYQGNGWFLQRYGGGWRWHLGGISCDGGRPVVGKWVHLAGSYDGRTARLYQSGIRPHSPAVSERNTGLSTELRTQPTAVKPPACCRAVHARLTRLSSKGPHRGREDLPTRRHRWRDSGKVPAIFSAKNSAE